MASDDKKIASDIRDQDARARLAIIITTFSIVGITIISIVFIAVSDDRGVAASQVFTGVLPLYGTWVGTLLAFYFAKENFDTATNNTVRLSQISAPTQTSILEELLVSQAISPNRLISISSSNSPENLDALKDFLKNVSRGRAPICKVGGELDFIVTYQDVDDIVQSKTEVQSNLKLKDCLDELRNKCQGRPIAYVKDDFTLLKANEERKKKVNCLDIVVTKNGTENDVVIGYLNSADIDRYNRSVDVDKLGGSKTF